MERRSAPARSSSKPLRPRALARVRVAEFGIDAFMRAGAVSSEPATIQRVLQWDVRQPSLAPLLRLNRGFHRIRELAQELQRREAEADAAFAAAPYDEMLECLRLSFAAEESLLQELSYWDLRSHRDDHRLVHQGLLRMRGAFLDADRRARPSMREALAPYIVHHHTFDACLHLLELQTRDAC